MAQISLRMQYRAVTSNPLALCRFFRAMHGGNGRALLSLLIADPKAVVAIGKHFWEERLVRLSQSRWWEIKGRAGFNDEVPCSTLNSAVTAVNAKFAAKNLHYRLWRQCRNGNPKSARSFRSVAPFVIGLVDIRYPKRKSADTAKAV